ncbi:MAG: putative DNA binding domain-containing protein [Bacteroidales bacterium]|nr:putative DNA binding domain-containing protein [Bacteroidales bacterium]
MKENQQTEFKQTWRDEYLKWICGFANAEGGKILIGVNDDGTVCGVSDAKRLIEDIPNKVKNELAIMPHVSRLEKDGLEYIGICITSKTSEEYLNGSKGITKLPKDSQRIPKEISESVRRTYDAIAENPRLTIKELSERLEISDRTIKKHIAYLKKESLIERVGGKTHGHWQVKTLEF